MSSHPGVSVGGITCPNQYSCRRPLVDTIAGSKIKNLKELRPGSGGTSKIRLLFVFDPWRSAVLLVAGDKSGKWNRWYAEATPHAEQLDEIYLKERAEEEEGR
jgi:hypothetical protein